MVDVLNGFFTMKYLLFTIALAYSFPIFAQKYDETWLMGYNSSIGATENEFGLTILSFTDKNKPQISFQDSPLRFSKSITVTSNRQGKLLFYSNAVDINNRNHTILKGSLDFNSSTYIDKQKKWGSNNPQTILTLPSPKDTNLYYVICQQIIWNSVKGDIQSIGLNYSIIDEKGDNGLGEMVKKNNIILEDTLNSENLTAVRHANGRDWWIIITKYVSNEYYRILLSPKGFEVIGTQKIGEIIKNSLSQTCFSPDGTKYVHNGLLRYDEPADITLYDFDRSTGLLSNSKRISYTVGTVASGVAFSPDNRFLYTSSSNKLMQWDLKNKDFAKSGDTIAIYDGYKEEDFFQTNFYLMQLAPDGKIYLNTVGSTKNLHIIHKPNKKGLSCQFQQRGLRLKSWNAKTLPNFPNFRLGPIDGSPCDTLGIDNVPVALFRYERDSSSIFKVEFTNLSYYEPTKWEWDFGEGSPKVMQEEPPIHVFSKKGEYNVCLSVSNSYGKHTYCRKIGIGVNVVAVDELEFKNIQIYPNPTKSELNISYSQEELENSELIINDLQGKVIFQKRLNFDKIDVSNFPHGIYFLQIRKENKVVFREKIVILE
jgi:hypothetical protein